MSNPNVRRPPAPPPFVMSPAEFTGTNLMIGLVSPSGGGKTKSALELARGIQVVSGGKIGIADTENLRALHYAKEYQFLLPDGSKGLHHLPFDPPFGPLRYKAAYEYMVSQGVKVIITDSFSHEHDGIGGVLEIHDDELTRMRDPSAWGKPKGERNELVGYILQVKGVHWIFCFRAKEKMRWKAGQPPEARGLMPQGNESFIFEQTCNFLLPAGANGVPVLSSPYPDEELILKTPGQFRHLFTEPRQLSRALGTHLAAWATPSWKGELPPLPTPMKRGQSTSVSYTSQSATNLTTAETAATTAAATVSTEGVTVDSLVAKLGSVADLAALDALSPVCKKLIETASPEDALRLKNAANAALDRLDPVVEEDRAPETVAAPASIAAPVSVTPASAPAVPVSDQANEQANEQVNEQVDEHISEIARLNAEGLARFREALASFGESITQEQAGQLMLDHLDEEAPHPKVGTEDGSMAQREILAKTIPPFKSVSQLGVMARHLDSCRKHPPYKTYSDDLMLCDSPQNVFECWLSYGPTVDAMPDKIRTDARDRTGKRIKALDDSITSGGVWLTKKIKEHAAKIVAEAAAGALAEIRTTTPVSDASPAMDTATTTPTVSTDRPAHRPITSDPGQTFAIRIEEATTDTELSEIKTKIERGRVQKRLPGSDFETLIQLHDEKLAKITTAA